MPRIESKKPAKDSTPKDPELAALIRTNLIRTLGSLALLFALLAVAGSVFEDELLSLTEVIHRAVGIPGLLGMVFVSDAFFSPIPPDAVLVVVANSTLQASWLWLVPVAGVVSAIAGNCAWYLGRVLSGVRWAAPWLRRIRARHQEMLHRYDGWAVLLGAVTPLPFSLICISTGALGMRWARLAPITLVRIPWFLICYLVIAGSAAL